MTCLILVGGAAATTKEGRRCAAVSGRLMTSDDGVVAAKGGVMRDGAVLLAGWQLQQPVMLQTTPRRGSRRWCRGGGHWLLPVLQASCGAADSGLPVLR